MNRLAIVMLVSLLMTNLDLVQGAKKQKPCKGKNCPKEVADGPVDLHDYTYTNNTDDWKDLFDTVNNGTQYNYCKYDQAGKQSPVNLMQPIGSYGWAYGLPVPKTDDANSMQYRDLQKDVKINWARTTNKVKLHPEEQLNNWFKSNLAERDYKAVSTEFMAKQLHFHTPSEHTINGKHFDLEMHIVHQIKLNETTLEEIAEMELNGTSAKKSFDDIQYGVLGLFFSVEEYDRSITQAYNESVQLFFEHLRFEDYGEPIVDRIALGELMDKVDLNDRWVYHGSFTTPPCTPIVYWNVINNILPIKIDQFARFKEMMNHRNESIGATFNNRPIQAIRNQNIQYVGAMHLSGMAAVSMALISGLTSVLY